MWDKPWELWSSVSGKCFAGNINLGDADIAEAVIIDEIFWSQLDKKKEHGSEF